MEKQLQNTAIAQTRIDGALEAQLPAASEKFHPKGPATSHGAPLRQILDAPATLAESLLRAARQSPEKGIVYVQQDGAETFQSYPELLEEAERVLTGLRKLGLQPGDKLIFQLDRSQDFISVFWGCVFGGFIPVPLSVAPTYQQVNSTVSKLRKAWKLLDPRVVVSSRTLTLAIRSATELPQAEGFRVEAIDDLRARERTQYWHVSRPDDLVLLLLTSGSTGVPKAVMHSHRALLHRSAATAQKNGFTSDDVSLNWLPLDHVGGIVMCHLRDVYLGCQQIQVQSELILGDPLKWLDLIERHRASMTWAPNFAYGLINAAAEEVRTQKWDLSSMRFILNGGEEIVAKTARRFLELLASFGLSATAMHPAWGMSETSSAVTYSDRFSLDSTIDDDRFVEVGSPIPGVSLRIVDAHNGVVEEETIGSVQVKGLPITGGYYNNPHLNREAFTDDGWFRTGDLGFVRQGRLTITGREKDVIIVNGVNYHSQTIEAVIEEIDGVERSYTAACAVRLENVNTDGLAVFFHPSSWKESDLIELLRSVRRKVVNEVGVNPDYLLPVQKDQIPKTSIGKIQRTQLIDRFRRGEFDAILRRVQILNDNPSTPSAPLPEAGANNPEGSEAKSSWGCRTTADELGAGTDVERQLAGIWQEILGVSHVGLRDNFFDLGGHSLLGGRVIYRVREAFGVQLSLRCLFDSPTVVGIAEAIGRAREADQSLQFPPLIPVSREDTLPLSFSQRRLWFLDQWNPNSSAYNIPAAFRLTGPLNVTALERSLNEIVRRHESLRTRFRVEGAQPVQVVAPAFAVTLEIIDLRVLGEVEREAEAQRLCTEHARRPFDLTQDSLVRPSLLWLGEEDHILLLTLHHIVCDGWSLGVLYQELSVLYRAFSNDTPSPLPEMVIQYADYAVWQREFLKGDVLEKQLTYWKTKLEGAPTVLNLPLDRPRPAVHSYPGARKSFELSRELTRALKVLSRREGATLFMTLLAAFQSLLHRYTGQEDILVGAPIAGRNRTDLESLIGFIVNTIVLRSDVSGNPTFKELLERVREVALGAYAHQDLPFEKLVEDLRPERHLSHSPLFQVMFSLQNMPTPALQLSGLAAARLEIDCATSKFDLTLTMVEEAGPLTGTMEYNTDLFEASTIERMLDHFRNLLEGIVTNPEQRISQLPLLSEAEKHQLLVEWNTTKRDYPSDKCFHQLFEEQVERTPETAALVFEDQQLTYRELNNRANQLAHYLRKLGVGLDVLVGINVEQSMEMVVGLLGILKAGGAYVPLDPRYPKERLGFMLEDAQIRLLLTQEKLVVGTIPSQLVCLDRDWGEIARESVRNPQSGVRPASLAYVIYTSGSTGKPKGVMIDHRCLVNYLCWFNESPLAKTMQSLPVITRPTFDASLKQLFAPLLRGAPVWILPEEVVSQPAALRDALTTRARVGLNCVPSLWRAVLEDLNSDRATAVTNSLSSLFLGGEPLDQPLVDRTFAAIPAIEVWNLYGPTEATANACTGRIRLHSALTIGRPIANTQLYILDGNLQPVPTGVPGELHIGGDGLARGYLNRPELTAEKFIEHSFNGEPARRLYKTGDRARYFADGNIEFLGRIDNQVKIRGYRIELGEIEAVLGQHPGIREAVVLAREDNPGEKWLIAYIVSTQQWTQTANELRSYLREKLPEYMVPSAFVFVGSVPLTPNGKVDLCGLPPPGLVQRDEFVAPRTPAEEKIAEIWAEVLRVDKVGVDDNFFDLGGHSLLATQVVSRVRAAFQVELPLRSLFENPTVARLVGQIAQTQAEAVAPEEMTALVADLESLSDEEAQKRLSDLNPA